MYNQGVLRDGVKTFQFPLNDVPMAATEKYVTYVLHWIFLADRQTIGFGFDCNNY